MRRWAIEPKKGKEEVDERTFWGLDDPVMIDGKLVDLHQWVTEPWDADWWEDTDEEWRDPIVEEEPKEEKPKSEVDLIAEEYVRERMEREKKEWDDMRAAVGKYKDYDNSRDIRLQKQWDEKQDWTHEEIMEMIGWDPSLDAAMQVISPFHRVDYAGLRDLEPETMDWMEENGLIMNEEEMISERAQQEEEMIQWLEERQVEPMDADMQFDKAYERSMDGDDGDYGGGEPFTDLDEEYDGL
mmetsp:Transcript_7336/g.12966  ORF Transcript_7336/g.12966 Transcript_7336/m.12966 type:complete len:241 (-) Transcript_7336:551-1273(-)